MLPPHHGALGPTPRSACQELIRAVFGLAGAGQIAASGDRQHIISLIDLVLQVPALTASVIDAIVINVAKTDIAPEVLTHLTDAVWSKPYPLHVQPYARVFRPDPMLHLGLMGGMQQSSWPRQSLARLREALATRGDAQHESVVLSDDFSTIAAQVRTLAQGVQQIKELKARTPMDVAQIETILAAQQVLGTLAGHDILDIGRTSIEVVTYLTQQGARARQSGADTTQGLYGLPPTPAFDLVLATGVLEPGAFEWPGIGTNHYDFDLRVDELVAAAAQLLRPNGVLVVRNVSYPLPFTREALVQAGLSYVPTDIPFATPSFGGRSAVWRRA